MPFASEFFFEIRKRIPSLRKRSYREVAQPKDSETLLALGFPEGVAEGLSQRVGQLNAFYDSILSQVSMPNLNRISVLDVGSKDFAYSPALSKWALSLQAQSKNRALVEGIELDPYPIYFDFFKRSDAAQYYVNLCHRFFSRRLDLTYRQGDWLQFHPAHFPTIITSFFPFLYSDLHQGAGLPQRAFDPERFYRKIFRTTEAYALFAHQGIDEVTESLALIKKIGEGRIVQTFHINESTLMPRKHSVHILVWKRDREV